MNPNELLKNFETLTTFIEDNFTNGRREQLLEFYGKLADRIATAPASTKKGFHNAFPGGYVLHVLNVINCANKLSALWSDLGYQNDYTAEELNFVALNHDLGKIGSLQADYYIPCTEEWLRKKGTEYVINPVLQYMKVPERSLLLLQQSGIKITEKEYLAIKLHDGLYEDGNKAYFINYNEDMALKSNLPYVIHQADLIASKIEGQPSTNIKPKSGPAKTGNRTLDKFLNE